MWNDRVLRLQRTARLYSNQGVVLRGSLVVSHTLPYSRSPESYQDATGAACSTGVTWRGLGLGIGLGLGLGLGLGFGFWFGFG